MGLDNFEDFAARLYFTKVELDILIDAMKYFPLKEKLDEYKQGKYDYLLYRLTGNREVVFGKKE